MHNKPNDVTNWRDLMKSCREVSVPTDETPQYIASAIQIYLERLSTGAANSEFLAASRMPKLAV
jgi:hypothetical protein